MKRKIILMSTFAALLSSGIASVKAFDTRTHEGVLVEMNYKDRTPWYKRPLGQKPYQNYFYNKTKHPISVSNHYDRNVAIPPGKKGVVWGAIEGYTRHGVFLEKTGAQEVRINEYIRTPPKSRVDVTYSQGNLILTPREQ